MCPVITFSNPVGNGTNPLIVLAPSLLRDSYQGLKKVSVPQDVLPAEYLLVAVQPHQFGGSPEAQTGTNTKTEASRGTNSSARIPASI
jgi:hypothetical protein